MSKEDTSLYIQEYIDECRKKIFPVLLAKKTGKKEIASALGFRDVHSLYKWQKKLYRKESCWKPLTDFAFPAKNSKKDYFLAKMPHCKLVFIVID